jgi:signal transduction histidine kinase
LTSKIGEDSALAERLGTIADPTALLLGLFAHAPVAFQIFRVDGHSLLVNQAFRDLFGSEPPPAYSIFEDEIAQRQGLLPLIRRAFSGQTVHVPAFWYDPRELTKVDVQEGRRVAIEMTMFPLLGANRVIGHVAMSFKDVTERMELEAELDRLRALQEHSTEVTTIQRADRSVTFDHPGIRGVISHQHDVTDLKSAAEAVSRSERVASETQLQTRQIQEANRLKCEFLANMSHELRTPLNVIIGFAELMFDGQVDPASPQHQEFLGDILASGRHLLQLINDVLDLARVEAGKVVFRPEPVAPAKLVGEVCAILRSTVAGKNLSIKTNVDATLTEIVVDPLRFKQILYNFLSNALKFTPDGGRVVVRVRREGQDKVRVEVEDTGIGIAAGDIAHLFTEFQQLDGGAAKKHRGTRLGLALTRRLVEAQGGTVGVKSVLGKGSTFHAILPLRAFLSIPTEQAR